MRAAYYGEKRFVLGADFTVIRKQCCWTMVHSKATFWGANFYPERSAERRLQYISMINLRPANGNQKQEIESFSGFMTAGAAHIRSFAQEAATAFESTSRQLGKVEVRA